jgi:hypothetical protein
VTAKTTSPEAIMGDTLAGRLRALRTRGQMAQRSQIVELRCEMPKCYCHKGRGYFESRLRVDGLRDVPTGAAHLASIFRAP